MTDIKSMTKDELKNLMTELGEKPFRAKQIYSWLHEHLVTSYDEMGNIPGKLKEKLKDYPIAALEWWMNRFLPLTAQENICSAFLMEM